MSRLIDADALIKNHGDDVCNWGEPYAVKKSSIENAPTIDPVKWIPVEERLPESGAHVLLCCEVRPSGTRYVCDGYFAKEDTIPCSNSDEVAFHYSEEKDEYFISEGFYEVIKNWDDFGSVTIEDFATHWMPLPEPPKGGAHD